MSRSSEVHAVVVTYHPDEERLVRALKALGPQVSKVIIVDNGGQRAKLEEILGAARPASVLLLPQPGNVGLAAAQNEGMRRAVDAGAGYVLLLDQDSVPAHDMVARLVAGCEAASSVDHPIGAAGPLLEDERSSARPYFVRTGLLRIKRVYCTENGATTVSVDMLISSGMLIPSDVLRDVGGMDDAFFIDHVDTDWCLRALSRRYRLIGVCDARLSHRLGEKSVPVLGSRRFLTHSSTRYYYIFRNSLLLYSRRYPGLKWKLTDAMRLSAIFVALLVYAEPRARAIRAAICGVADGLRGRGGPAPESVK